MLPLRAQFSTLSLVHNIQPARGEALRQRSLSAGENFHDRPLGLLAAPADGAPVRPSRPRGAEPFEISC